MKKIPTLFVREFENHKVVRVTKEFTSEECKRAFLEGTPTIKFDGSCCAVIDGEFYKRYDAKKGKPIPEGAIKCQEEADPVTGHLPCWIKVSKEDPSDKWFLKAWENYCILRDNIITGGTYEACGKHFNGNPYNCDYDFIIPHGKTEATLKSRTFEAVKDYLRQSNQEGLVFWLEGKPVCKIKRTDFGFEWPIKENNHNTEKSEAEE